MIPLREQCDLLSKALKNRLVQADDTVFAAISFDVIQDRLQTLEGAFPQGCIHSVAIKSNPLREVLRFIAGEGYHAEAASMGEVRLALASGFTPDRIVFDSPVKTDQEIRWCVEHLSGAIVNANSLEELLSYPEKVPFHAGLRVNPAMGIDTHRSMDVSGSTSKFGEPLPRNPEPLASRLVTVDVLDTLHIHQGSQSRDFEAMAEGISKVILLANMVNKLAGGEKIKTVDIGGGMPVNYEGEMAFGIDEYAAVLKEAVPELFDGSFQVVTEFGRYVHAHAGWTVTRVEEVKQFQEKSVAVMHAGADLFLRESYNPGEWPHKISILGPDFQPRERTSMRIWDLAGPLCFGGDVPFRNVELPEIRKGDFILVHDTGANTHALWSRHCSRPFPKIIGYDKDEVRVIRKRESLDEIIRFWS